MSQPTEQEIDDALNECAEHEEDGDSKFPGMTYEQGVANAIRWMRGESGFSNPMDD